MKIIVSTSDKYLHIIPIFLHLYRKYWDAPCEIVGYKKPDIDLPEHITFHSMGEQIGGPENFSGDLRKYFEKQPDTFIWLMEDTFIKSQVDLKGIKNLFKFMDEADNIGRFSLTHQSLKFYTDEIVWLEGVRLTPPDSDYRLSTQPAMWNMDYLLKYLTPGMNPWQFENQHGTLMQTTEMYYKNMAYVESLLVNHNEGVRKRDLYAYDLNGIDEETITEMKLKGII